MARELEQCRGCATTGPNKRKRCGHYSRGGFAEGLCKDHVYQRNSDEFHEGADGRYHFTRLSPAQERDAQIRRGRRPSPDAEDPSTPTRSHNRQADPESTPPTGLGQSLDSPQNYYRDFQADAIRNGDVGRGFQPQTPTRPSAKNSTSSIQHSRREQGPPRGQLAGGTTRTPTAQSSVEDSSLYPTLPTLDDGPSSQVGSAPSTGNPTPRLEDRRSTGIIRRSQPREAPFGSPDSTNWAPETHQTLGRADDEEWLNVIMDKREAGLLNDEEAEPILARIIKDRDEANKSRS